MKDMLKGAISFGVMVSLPIICTSVIGAAIYKAGFDEGRSEKVSRENQAV